MDKHLAEVEEIVPMIFTKIYRKVIVLWSKVRVKFPDLLTSFNLYFKKTMTDQLLSWPTKVDDHFLTKTPAWSRLVFSLWQYQHVSHKFLTLSYKLNQQCPICQSNLERLFVIGACRYTHFGALQFQQSNLVATEYWLLWFFSSTIASCKWFCAIFIKGW